MIVVKPDSHAPHDCERTTYEWNCPNCSRTHSVRLVPFDDVPQGQLLQLFVCMCDDVHAIRLD
jgi:hypothetical protein